MDNQQKIKLGVGVLIIGVLGFTINYLMKQIRLLVNTEFEMVGTSVNKVSLQQISITLWWKVVNKSDISATISDQVYDIYLNGKFVKKVGYAVPVEIKAKADTRIPTYIVFEPKELLNIGFENMGKFLTPEGRKELNLQVRGTFTVKTSVFEVKKFPFEFEDDIESIYNY
jgi:LEA14-like dessication related protein